jgi:HK97 family phage prohead protease
MDEHEHEEFLRDLSQAAPRLGPIAVCELKDVNLKRREVTHLISTGVVDRQGDIVDAGGWSMKDYRKNPIVLANHDYSIFSVIGKSVGQASDEKGLYATTQFGSHMLGEEALMLVANDLVRAWSVGFQPLEAHPIRTGKAELQCAVCDSAKGKNLWMHFTKQALLEYSLVAVPANQEVVNNAIQLGIKKDHLPHFFREVSQPADAALNGATAAKLAPRRADIVRDAVEYAVQRAQGARRSAEIAAVIRDISRQE